MIWVAPSHAAWSTLTEQQIQTAIAHGKATYEQARASGRAVDDLEPEYVVNLGPEVGLAMLFTEFATLALETRRWQAIGQELKAEDIERILLSVRGRLVVSVVVVGPQRDFLRQATARLLQEGRRISPVNWEVFLGNPEPGSPRRYAAPAQYKFSVKDVDLNAPATLLISAADGREIRFDFDLARVR